MNRAPDAADFQNGQFGASTTVTGNNLFSDLAGSGLMEAPGTVTLVTDPLLAPLGDYGGPTQTRPPLPGSPAIDNAGSFNPGGTDQRGFPRFFNNMLDIGAVEFQGNQAELDLAFEEDIDGDGTSVGVELAIGTNPLVSDPENTANLRLIDFTEDDEPIFNFGLVVDQQDNLILRLTRSTDLLEFTPIFTSTDGFTFPIQGIEILRFEDTAPPAGGKAFYRLEAERRPTTP